MDEQRSSEGPTTVHPLGAFITAERQRRSWTRKRLAAELRRVGDGSTTGVQTIKGWELYGIRPHADAMHWLARVFDVPVGRLVSLADGKLEPEEDEADRREFSRLAALSLAGVFVPGGVDVERLAAAAVDGAWLRDAEAVTNGFLAQWYAATPAVLVPPVVAHLVTLQQALPGSPELENLTGRTALLAGHLLLMVQRTGEARTCYALTESLARDTRDDELVMAALICRSALHDWRRGRDPQRSAELVEAAAGMLSPGTSPHLRVWALARRAEERAGAGDALGFERDMTAAEAALRPGRAAYWGPPRDAAELAAVRGAAELLLGRHRDAADTLAWTLERMNPDAVNWRALVAADRDRALAAL
jgi:transcriptional regulator with XRE-family HTH domain